MAYNNRHSRRVQMCVCGAGGACVHGYAIPQQAGCCGVCVWGGYVELCWRSTADSGWVGGCLGVHMTKGALTMGGCVASQRCRARTPAHVWSCPHTPSRGSMHARKADSKEGYEWPLVQTQDAEAGTFTLTLQWLRLCASRACSHTSLHVTPQITNHAHACFDGGWR